MTRRWFDDLEVGFAERSPSRTLTDADIAAFADLSGDFNRLHTDPEYAAGTEFGRPIAHGLLVTAIGSGLFTRTELSRSLEESIVAMLGIECRFKAPVMAGDTLQLDAQVRELRPTRDGQRGIAVIVRELLNQRGECVQTATTPMLLARRSPKGQGAQSR